MDLKKNLFNILKVAVLIMFCLAIYMNNIIFMITTISFQFISAIVFGWSILISILGNLKKKEYKKFCEKNFKFNIIICAHNEENVIHGILNSIEMQTYPADYWKVYLIADNCTDNTVKIANKYNFVHIYEHKTEGAKRKGIALKWGINKILADHSDFGDAFIVFDADNQIIPEFLEVFNRKFQEGSKIVAGKRVAINPYDSLIANWYAIYWSIIMNLFCKPHKNLGLSATLSGTGLGFTKESIEKNGFNTKTMTEDIEFAMQNNIKGTRIDYAEEAIYYDEQPTSFKPMVHQLSRWATGGNETIKYYIKDMLKAFIKSPSIKRFDSLCTTFVGNSMAFSVLTGIMLAIMAFRYGGFWSDYAFKTGMILNLITYLVAIFSAKACNLKIKKLAFSILLYPVFILMFGMISFGTIFFPEKIWYKIEHYGKYLNERRKKVETE